MYSKVSLLWETRRTFYPEVYHGYNVRTLLWVGYSQKTIEACFRSGKKKTHMSFGTTSAELRKLTMWLVENDCQSVAMESTGSYWKPIFNILELSGTDMEIIVVNARHMKNVPGRKTDVNDAEWIAELLQHGLLRPSFIPDREQRELRELSRYRKVS